MNAQPARRLAPVPTGNTFDKYGSRNPVVRRLMAGFQRSLDQLLAEAAPESVLDVGCGEGVVTLRWAQALGARRVVGLDLADPKLEAEWRLRSRPNLTFMAGQGDQLPFAAAEFDLVAAIETLEHIAQPQPTLAEMRRVARSHLLVSVPREPLWRALNLARGAYVGELGNTPGHVNHWSKRALAELLSGYGEIVELQTPFPWTIALVRIG
jgi:2-polyprenyl-3-methyl-5-hydroxy-6-metoxy-1,4-benzoquinol methylase